MPMPECHMIYEVLTGGSMRYIEYSFDTISYMSP